jgi:putative acetyltransferase
LYKQSLPRASDDRCYNPPQMLISIREMRPAEARQFLEVHHSAVREIASRDYAAAIIESWAPLPITDEAIEVFLANPGEEIRIVAVSGEEIIGIGALVLSTGELRACYVSPKAVRRGVGTALVLEIERIAKEQGVWHLHLVSSLTAEPFYRSLGYEFLDRSEHILNTGQRMACIRMEKQINT